MAELNGADTRYRCRHCGLEYPVDPGDCGNCGMSDFVQTGSIEALPDSLPPCPDAGHDPQVRQQVCTAPDCGQPIPVGQGECDYCGAPLQHGMEPISDVRAPDLVAADGTRIPLLNGLEVVLGRDPGESPWSRLMQGHTGVSRRHASVVVDDDIVRIRDLDSSNGTWVNGIEIDETAAVPVSDGIIIGLGHRYVLTVRTTK